MLIIIKTVKFVTVAIRLKVRWCVCAYFQNLIERRRLLHHAEITALILVLAPCGKALFEFLTAVVKLIQALIEAKKSKKK